MARMKFIGPKCSKCCLVTSVWGIIMFLLMGGAFRLHSPALYDDIPLNFKSADDYSNKTKVFQLYDETGTNCFIAAGLYVVVLFFSLWQLRVNQKLQAYTVR